MGKFTQAFGTIYVNTFGGIADYLLGEGAVLEPVAVVVDPDRTVYEEYVVPVAEETSEVILDPIVEYTEEVLEDLKEDTESILKWAAAIGLLYVALK